MFSVNECNGNHNTQLFALNNKKVQHDFLEESLNMDCIYEINAFQDLLEIFSHLLSSEALDIFFFFCVSSFPFGSVG